MADPINAAYESHDDQEMIAYHKLHTPFIAADVETVRNTDLSGRFGGLYVVALSSRFRIDTESVAADDGLNVLIDVVGTHFVRQAETVTPTSREYTDADVVAGSIDIASDVDVVFINVSTDVDVNVPAAEDRNGRILEIKRTGSGGFTPVLDGAETIDDNDPANYAVTTDGGFLRLAPKTGGYALIGSQL